MNNGEDKRIKRRKKEKNNKKDGKY